MKKTSIIVMLFLTISFVVAQSNSAEVKILTSAVCETCKETLEHYLSFEKGVKTAKLDLDTKFITVVYNPAKTDEQKIRVAVTKIGYDADSLKADPKAYSKLPKCCKHPDDANH
jgi:mercuric ion binding protein